MGSANSRGGFLIKNIIFDSDKTLVETGLAMERLFEYIAEKYFSQADTVGVSTNLKAAVDTHSIEFKNLPQSVTYV